MHGLALPQIKVTTSHKHFHDLLIFASSSGNHT
jgi:hypothetical protein